MIAESNLQVSWRARPRGFVALMSLYESNYLRLAALAGDLRQLAANRISSVADDCTLVLNVLGRARYTSELLLSYLLPASGAAAVLERVPDLRLRVYHDARLLEACSAAPTGPERELDRRWARNMMVNKWLEYCAERGHRFARGGADTPSG
ncbi:MAG: DUF1249 domain-containing protein [Gammaproteobacteria bacterium]|nr:DUF1249 domain-containing protein [Gammaproteobacteria bacterium]MDE2251980.1 DUF1249 domain-containing protein [Gammaproteobacteria bacterium]